ncbi:hypothetical protein P7K49_012950 [Saguinus oedipus]|uniref:Uncharacterized protein n=1 Tax=Saguinus oedipus TaxID=9490 RepID=A0ABQ9VF37_SAGOE|nr:hypothetical protein P7K49_012950 [Saguinus oedipus]
MDCAPSIHASESGTAHHSGEEAEDAPRPAAPPLSSGGSHLPQGQKTGLVESEPSDGRGKKDAACPAASVPWKHRMPGAARLRRLHQFPLQERVLQGNPHDILARPCNVQLV